MPDAQLPKSSSAALHDLRTVASWLEASGGGAPEDRAHWVGVLRAAADSLERLATMSPAFSTKNAPCPTCRGVGDQRVVAGHDTDEPCRDCGGSGRVPMPDDGIRSCDTTGCFGVRGHGGPCGPGPTCATCEGTGQTPALTEEDAG